MLDAFAAARLRRVRRAARRSCSQRLRHGGAGCISATANVNPAPIARLYDTWQDADADAQQARLDEIRGIFRDSR